MIRIQTGGPLGTNRYEFKADEGSAMAVANAIKFLSTELFRKAVARDHEMHEEGACPAKGYGGFKLPEVLAAEAEQAKSPEALVVPDNSESVEAVADQEPGHIEPLPPRTPEKAPGNPEAFDPREEDEVDPVSLFPDDPGPEAEDVGERVLAGQPDDVVGVLRQLDVLEEEGKIQGQG